MVIAKAKKRLLVAAAVLMAGTLAHGDPLADLTHKEKESLVLLVKALDDGLILPFLATDCPEKWDRYTDANGRFIVGSGQFAGGAKSIPLGPAGNLDYGHDHPKAITEELNGGSAHRKDDDRSDSHSSASNHQHTVTIATSEWLPPHFGVVFCRLR